MESPRRIDLFLAAIYAAILALLIGVFAMLFRLI
jgi:hypothetical protein